MTEDDLDAIMGIEMESFPRPWTITHFQDELNSPHSFPLVAFDQSGTIVGYICPMLVLDEGHILDVAVHKDFRGRGIGRMLIERVLRDCLADGAEVVSLEVRTSNTVAINLYKSMGFKESGIRKRYYENGEDAVMMEHIFETEECTCSSSH